MNPATASPPGSRERWAWVAPLVIVGVGLWAYANSLRGPFHFDDVGCIVDNPVIRRAWPGWHALLVPPANGLIGRPLVTLSLILNYAAGGLHVIGYHAVNLAIHLGAALALFGIVRRTLQRPWLAGAIALLWTVHPLQTESVTYIIQRAESLMALCYLLTLYSVIRSASSRHPRGWWIAAVVSGALGMAGKPVMATAPLLVFLYDRVFLAGSFRGAWRARRPLYLGLAATWGGLLALLVVWATHAQPTAGFALPTMSAWAYARTQPWVILHYLRLTLWPHPLVVDYSWPIAETWDTLAMPVLGFGALIALTVAAWRRSPAAGFPGLAFWLLLAPTSSVIPVADLAVEHRMYLPLAPALAALVWSADAWLRRLVADARLRRILAAGALAAIVAALGVATLRRNRDYLSEETLWRDTVAARPANPRARNNLAQTLTQEGKADEAVVHLTVALRLYPAYADAHYNLATALARQGKLKEAIAEYRIAVRLNPNTSAQMHSNLGVALAEQGALEDARRHFEEAVQLNPESAVAHYNLANLLAQQGQLDEALTHYTESLRLNPDAPETHTNAGNTLFLLGRVDDAIAHYATALRLDPRHVNAHARLGAALAQRGRVAEAIPHYLEALRLQPDVAETHNDAGAALAQQGQLDAATAHIREALRLKPGYAEAHNNLGNVFFVKEQMAEAVAEYQAALRLKPDYEAARANLTRALETQDGSGR